MRRLCTKNDAPAKKHGIREKIKLQNAEKTNSSSSGEVNAMLAPTSKPPEQREFVVDSGALMQMPRKYLSSHATKMVPLSVEWRSQRILYFSLDTSH